MPWIESRYTARCAECKEAIFAGEKCWWEPDSRKVYCEGNGCGEEMALEALPKGNAPVPLRNHESKVVMLTGGKGSNKTHAVLVTPCPDCYHPMGDHNERGCTKCRCVSAALYRC